MRLNLAFIETIWMTVIGQSVLVVLIIEKKEFIPRWISMVFHCFSSAFQSVVPFESKPRIIRMIIMIAFGFFLASGDANE